MAVTKGQIVKYAILPGFWPRFRALLGNGFYHVAYFIALIYSNVRLLPAGHPYLNPDNIGRYGLRHVVAEASNNLVFSKKNIDQIFVFFMILAGVVLLLMQFVLLFVSLLTGPALALGLVPFVDWFQNPSQYSPRGPSQDIAFIILDRVFGLQGFFDSCVSNLISVCVDVRGNPLPPLAQYPSSLHTALHQLLLFYSNGIVLVAVLVLLYFVTTIVGETIAEGTPFGQRYNKAWVPIRIIMFFALIIPLNIGQQNEGLNGAQIITFWTAKWGSNMATNTWGRFNQALTGSYLGALSGTETANLIATPNVPEVGALHKFFFTVKMCQMAEKVAHDIDIKAYVVREHTTGVDQMLFQAADVDDFRAILAFAKNGTINIRFGELDPDYAQGLAPSKYSDKKGYVFPWCGEIKVQPTDLVEPGAMEIQADYLATVDQMWLGTDDRNAAVLCTLRRTFPINGDPSCPEWPDKSLFLSEINFYETYAFSLISDHINTQVLNGDWTVPQELLEKGWAGAAIWYHRIARMNGAVTTAVINFPRPYKYPYVMEEIYKQHRMESEVVSGPGRFDPLLPDGKLADFKRPYDQDIAASLYRGYKFWEEDDGGATSHNKMTDSMIINVVNTIFGTSGLFDMRHNPTTHPLAQLSSLGKAMIEAAVRNALVATGGIVGSSLSDLFGPFVGQMAGVGTSFFLSFVQMTITMGVILYYVLPFLPFIYFLFAVSGWIKSIFEAIVAMPLWALAHIHIDGEGLPGRNAGAGYYLLLEILLRPTLIVFGLLGSIIIFSSLVTVLNQAFDIIVSNVGGFDAKEEATNPGKIEFYRAPIDEFFFTAMYVVIVYMLAQSVFKLIDQIPNNILRWIGNTTSTFQEGAGDPAAELSSQVYRGGQLTVAQASGTMQGMLPHLVS